MNELTEIKDIKIIDVYQKDVGAAGAVAEVTDLLKDGWILLKISTEKLLRYDNITVSNKFNDGKFEKVQPFDVFVTRFILGHTEETKRKR